MLPKELTVTWYKLFEITGVFVTGVHVMGGERLGVDSRVKPFGYSGHEITTLFPWRVIVIRMTNDSKASAYVSDGVMLFVALFFNTCRSYRPAGNDGI